jgi:type IV secretory pathway VirB2 component (pilin)
MNTSKINTLAQQTKQQLRQQSARLAQAWVGLNCLVLAGAANAQQQGGGNFNFDRVRDILQAFVNFMIGPFGRAAVIISIVAAFVTWVFAPKEGIFGPVLRVVVAGVAILNATVWVASLGTPGQLTL